MVNYYSTVLHVGASLFISCGPTKNTADLILHKNYIIIVCKTMQMKKLFSIPFAVLLTATLLSGQSKPLNIIAIGAHPDDCDSKFGGTAALFAKMGHNVKFLALTSGDAGHQSQGGGALGN